MALESLLHAQTRVKVQSRLRGMFCGAWPGVQNR